MTVYLSNRDGNGKTNEEGHYRLLSKVLQGQVLATDDLKVTENTTLDMTVLVNSGDYRLQVTNYAYMGWLDAPAQLTISAPDSTSPRITLVVLYVDKQAATSPAPPNNPGIAKIITVDGSANTNPSAPTNSAIQSAVGSGNPYMVLASIEVNAGATVITDEDITDMRTEIEISEEILSPTALLASVGPLIYPVGTIYENSTNSANPATYFGFGTWEPFAVGRVTVGILTDDDDFGLIGQIGGAKGVTISETQMPIHRHLIDPPASTTGAGGVHNHQMNYIGTYVSGYGLVDGSANRSSGMGYTSLAGNHTHSINIPAFYSGYQGGGQAHPNLQPYIVVYKWRRTA